jgi:FkbM family methyltransferase
MKEILCREITRRNPFELDHLPWIVRCYRYPFDRWSTQGKQGLYGAHNLLTFLLYRKFSPFSIKGSFYLTVNGQRKHISYNTKNATYAILYFKQYVMGYEPQVASLFDLVIPDKGVFYDIGSNWGWFSLMAATRPGFQGKIHAFEPFPTTHQDIASMVEQSGLGDRIQLHDFALMAEAGTASMFLPDSIHSGCATVTKENRGVGGIKTSMLDQFNGPPPDVMKVDVEGNESEVFIGGKKTIAQHKPMIAFENKRDTEDLAQIMRPLQLLEELGYVFYHAAWLRQTGAGPCLVGDEFDPQPQPKETLALVPFQPAQRLLLHTAMNVIAVHRDKVGLLESKFEKRQV